MKRYIVISSDGELDISPMYTTQEKACQRLNEMFYELQDDLAGKFDESWLKHGFGWWFKKNETITHAAALKELCDGNVSCEKPKLALLTIRQFVERYAKLVSEGSSLPPSAFAIATVPKDKSDLEEVKSASSGWFGLKTIEHPFEAEGMCIAVGFYGNRNVELCVFDGDKSCGRTVYNCLLTTVLNCMNLYESVDEDELIIIEYNPEAKEE